ELRDYELTEEEWGMVEHLQNVLKLFSNATLFFSRAGPSLVNVIPAMDHLDDKLAKIALDPQVPRAVRAAASLGRKTCNRYYGRTDDSFVYRFAMAFHPEWKLDYFEEAEWEEEWIT
ncbi:hypothetical protein OH76DRAFT_1331804, partial [Lentinus brumalis]